MADKSRGEIRIGLSIQLQDHGGPKPVCHVVTIKVNVEVAQVVEQRFSKPLL